MCLLQVQDVYAYSIPLEQNVIYGVCEPKFMENKIGDNL
jgi:hypothetical protein